MRFSRLKTVFHYFSSTACRWHENGSSWFAVGINLFWLLLAWTLLPLENEPLRSYRKALPHLYPLINFDAPKCLDAFRWLTQSLYLLLFRVPVGAPSALQKALTVLYRRTHGAFERFGNLLNRYGSVILAGPDRSVDVIDKHSSQLPKSVKLAILWGMGAVAVGLAGLCITQPFNIQGQVVFLSVMLILALMLRQIKAR